MRPADWPCAGADDGINLALLKIAFPAFRFSQYLRGRRLRWVAVRKDSAGYGLHTLVTDDLTELLDAMLLDESASRPRRHPWLARSAVSLLPVQWPGL